MNYICIFYRKYLAGLRMTQIHVFGDLYLWDCFLLIGIFFLVMLGPAAITGVLSQKWMADPRYSFKVNLWRVVGGGVVLTGCFYFFVMALLLSMKGMIGKIELLVLTLSCLTLGALLSFMLSLIRYAWQKKVLGTLVDNKVERFKSAVFFAFVSPLFTFSVWLSLFIVGESYS